MERCHHHHHHEPSDIVLFLLFRSYNATIFLLIVFCLLVFSDAQHDTSEGMSAEFSPKEPLGASGSTMLVNCTLRGLSQDVTAHMLRCTFDDHILPTIVLSDSVAEIKLESVTRQMTGGHIFCHVNNSGMILSVGQLVIRVADIPIAPNITECIVYNWQRMICKWEPATQDTGLPINQTLAWSVMNFLNPDNACRRMQNNTCRWISNDKEDSFRMDMTYHLSVHVSNSVRSVKSRVYTIRTSDIVKPDPVINLRSTDVTSRSMTISWMKSYEEGGTERRIRYRMTYKSQWDDTNFMMNTTESLNLTLINLIPFTNYTIFVDCIPLINNNEQGFWSDKAKFVRKTEHDVPGQAPAITEGSFFRGSTEGNDGKIEIFWKPVPERFLYGATVQKPIRMRYFDVWKGSDDDVVMETFYFDSVASESIQLSTDKDYAVIIDITNDKGFNEDLKLQSLIIMSTKYGLKTVKNVIATGNRSEINVRWSPVVDFIIYTITVYWCEGAIHAPKLCKTPLNWISVSMNATNVTFDVGNSRHYAEYLVAVSVETYLPALSKIVSSGMKWAECVQNINNKVKPPTKLELAKSQTSFSIAVEWVPPNCVDTAYINAYELVYCQIRKCSENVCCFENKTLSMTDTSDRDYVIKNLVPDVEYEVRMRSSSEIGMSEFTDPVRYVVFRSGLTGGAIAGIVVGSIFLLILLTIGLLTILKKAKKYFDCCGEIKIVPPISRMISNPNDLNRSYPKVEYANYLMNDNNTEEDSYLLSDKMKTEEGSVQLRNHQSHDVTESPCQPLVNGEGSRDRRYTECPTAEVSSFLPPQNPGNPSDVPNAPGGEYPHLGDPSISSYAHLGILGNEGREEISDDDAVKKEHSSSLDALPATAATEPGSDALPQIPNHSNMSGSSAIAPYTTIGQTLGMMSSPGKFFSPNDSGVVDDIYERSCVKENSLAAVDSIRVKSNKINANDDLPVSEDNFPGEPKPVLLPGNINIDACSHDNDDVRFSDS